MKRREFITLLGGAAVAWPLAARAQQPGQFQAKPTRTAKERLGGKATDEQRVDNCKVPIDLHGPKPRPNVCGDAVSTGSTR